ncbi:hypothetical protein NQT62_03435 [Limnobacter humi]|uniref:Transmembrane protein n=1 Tax=Limnobacter humi TaxID=1778671 RepID=A0ABT1WFG2_9BURK|nr:hypothetical protein [Limnobacter humi]MCQ8895492.1 hypothetical protein [Limnobacter humi]
MMFTGVPLHRIFLQLSVWVCAASMFLLSACSPAFNWRVVPNPDSGYTATFPDKPALVTRTLDLANLKVPLTLQAAQVNGLYFAVGTVPLEGNLKTQQTLLVEALSLALANNIQAGKPALANTTWLGLPVLDMDSRGKTAKGGAAFVKARFFEHKGRLFEVIVMGEAEQPDPSVVAQWFNGFSVGGR